MYFFPQIGQSLEMRHIRQHPFSIQPDKTGYLQMFQTNSLVSMGTMIPIKLRKKDIGWHDNQIWELSDHKTKLFDVALYGCHCLIVRFKNEKKQKTHGFMDLSEDFRILSDGRRINVNIQTTWVMGNKQCSKILNSARFKFVFSPVATFRSAIELGSSHCT